MKHLVRISVKTEKKINWFKVQFASEFVNKRIDIQFPQCSIKCRPYNKILAIFIALPMSQLVASTLSLPSHSPTIKISLA